MTDHKFTDDEVIKALEVCVDNSSCKECPINPNHGNYGYCTNLALTYALALINRLKAEIERMTKSNDVLYEDNHILATEYAEEVRAKAIKEFAERLKHIIGFEDLIPTDCVMLFPYINNLVKEMTEGGHTDES